MASTQGKKKAAGPFDSDSDGDGDEELAQIKKKTDETMDASVAASRRMRQVAESTREVAGKTLDQLEDQGRQLNRLENKHDKIEDNLDEADRQLSLLERWCCGCCAGRKPPKIVVDTPEFTSSGKKNPNKRSDPNGKPSEADAKELRNSKGVSSGGGRSGGGTGGGGRSDDGKILKDDVREDELHENLDAVSDVLGDLRQQAQMMNSTLGDQNAQLSRITDRTENNLGHVKQANKRTEALTK